MFEKIFRIGQKLVAMSRPYGLRLALLEWCSDFSKQSIALQSRSVKGAGTRLRDSVLYIRALGVGPVGYWGTQGRGKVKA